MIDALYAIWTEATFNPDSNMNLNTPRATTATGKVLEMAGICRSCSHSC
ncbi:hypothetical protein [Apibacter adventoris]|nr:hypothetical protein [Apibacter adventoris]